MAYQPYPGTGATLTVATVTADVVDMELTLERKDVETTTLGDLYRTYIAGRYGGTLTATLAGSGDASSVAREIANDYLTQSARGSSVAFVLTDAGASSGGTSQEYQFYGIIRSATHSVRQDEMDTVRIEVVITGQITAPAPPPTP